MLPFSSHPYHQAVLGKLIRLAVKEGGFPASQGLLANDRWCFLFLMPSADMSSQAPVVHSPSFLGKRGNPHLCLEGTPRALIMLNTVLTSCVEAECSMVPCPRYCTCQTLCPCVVNALWQPDRTGTSLRAVCLHCHPGPLPLAGGRAGSAVLRGLVLRSTAGEEAHAVCAPAPITIICSLC